MMELIPMLEESETKGRAFITQDNKVMAEMTFSKAGKELIIIDHTEVDPALKGKGAGVKLLMLIVNLARERNIKILPLCPFAKSVFDKNSSISDVRK